MKLDKHTTELRLLELIKELEEARDKIPETLRSDARIKFQCLAEDKFLDTRHIEYTITY